jgi:hypothetical protein
VSARRPAVAERHEATTVASTAAATNRHRQVIGPAGFTFMRITFSIRRCSFRCDPPSPARFPTLTATAWC